MVRILPPMHGGQCSLPARLADLIVAGGALGLGACSSSVDDKAAQKLSEAGSNESGVFIPCGNANPDPCICGRPDGDPVWASQCAEKMSCEKKGGTYTNIT